MKAPGRFFVLLALAATPAACRPAPAPAPQPGHFLYASSTRSGDVSGFRVDDATGVLTPIPGGPFLGDHLGAQQLTFSPEGSFGFLRTLTGVVPFTVRADGSLHPRTDHPNLDGNPTTLAIHPSGRFLFTVNAYALDIRALQANGTVGPLIGGMRHTGSAEFTFDPGGDRLLIADGHQLHPYTFDQKSGALTEIAGRSLTAQYGATGQAVVHPGGVFVFVLGLARMSVFLRDGDRFQPVVGSPFALGDDAGAFTFDPAGRFLFVAHRRANRIAAYVIDDAGGLHPAAGSPFVSAAGPESIDVDANGHWLYVAYPAAGTVAVFTIDQQTGGLMPVADSGRRAGVEPRFLAVRAVPTPHPQPAELPAPDSASLQPIQTLDDIDRARRQDSAAVRQTEPPVSPRPQAKPIEPRLSCGADQSNDHPYGSHGVMVSNLEKIPLTVWLVGDADRRPKILRLKRHDEPDVDGAVEVTGALVANRPTPVTLRIAPNGASSDPTSARLNLWLEIPVSDADADKSVDDYLQTLRLTPQDRAASAGTMRAIFHENRVGVFDLVCRSGSLTAKSRIEVVSRGRFFAQPTFTRR